jgi:2,4-dienoyl-CoA reductase-like NADH-dependent reductase (Old Yellow Enzyme family)
VGLDTDFMRGFMGAGSSTIDPLLKRMGRDEFDLVAVGRALLGDPDWVEKIRLGRAAEILPYGPERLSELV